MQPVTSGALVKLIVVLVLSVMGMACSATGSSPFIGGDAKRVFEIACLDDEKNCDPQAKELCPNGYALIRNKSHVVAIWRGVDVVNRIRFELTISCQ